METVFKALALVVAAGITCCVMLCLLVFLAIQLIGATVLSRLTRPRRHPRQIFVSGDQVDALSR